MSDLGKHPSFESSEEAAAEVRLAVIGDYACIPTYWPAKPDGHEANGVPTSYYTAVQFVCRPQDGP